MKILYAIQGTGNGHLARASEIIPHLKTMADVDVLVSGIQGDLKLPFEVDYQFHGLSFIMGNKGGINFKKTVSHFRPLKLLVDMAKLPVQHYDLVFSDFEPISAWSCLLKGKQCIGISHQNAVLHQMAPRPFKNDIGGKIILKYYAPTLIKYGFHFQPLDENHFTPIVRAGIREAKPQNKKHYTVYLPAFSDRKIQQILAKFEHIQWEVFSKKCTEAYRFRNISFHPVSMERFTDSFVNCQGILTTAGFETPSEALFMGKKLCVVPMKNQYEQLCNATFLETMGVKVIYHLKKESEILTQWVESDDTLQIDYPDRTRYLLMNILSKHRVAETLTLKQWMQSYFSARSIQFKTIVQRGDRLVSFNMRSKNDLLREFLMRLFDRN
jgi:uncharacterized protein (TIGR00661 family)